MALSDFRARGLIAAAAALALASGCRVDIPENARFSCTTDEDCGGDGYVCAPTGATGVCCHSSAETCDGLDNDCNGNVDDNLLGVPCYDGDPATEGVGSCRGGTRACIAGAFTTCSGQLLPTAERCNGFDDDCDGQTDEDFDFATSPANCGGCGRPCGASDQCFQGQCIPSAEPQCDDGIDSDMDGFTDCADSDCDGRSCGTGCVCTASAKHETACAGGGDEDADGASDCADSDCVGLSCSATTPSMTCDAQAICSCGGTATPPPEAVCSDGKDEDCDGATDCADSDCEGASCGAGCSCLNSIPREQICNDLLDNDGDAKIDCADVVDCPRNTPCTFMQGGSPRAGVCQGNQTCK